MRVMTYLRNFGIGRKIDHFRGNGKGEERQAEIQVTTTHVVYLFFV
jgi:hypothetical protein